MKCPHCGNTRPDNTKYCPETGKKLESQFILCNEPDCDFRQPLPMGTKFCPNCGKPLSFQSGNMPTQNIKESQQPIGKLRALAWDSEDVYVINVNGDKIKKIEYKIRYTDAFREGLSNVYLDSTGLSGYINTDGEFVIMPLYTEALAFSDGIALVRKGEKTFYINTANDIVIYPSDTMEYISSFSDGLAMFKEVASGKIGYINKSGDIVIHPKYYWEPICGYGDFIDGLALVSVPESRAYFFIDKSGTQVGPKREYLFNYSEGLAKYYKKKRFGYLDRNFNEIIPPIFTEASDFSEGLALVTKNNRKIYINQSGETIIDLITDIFPEKSLKIKYGSQFHNGVAVFAVDHVRHHIVYSLYGVLNSEGKVLCDPIYDSITDFGY